ncbi:Gfo/Idh/MocA family protein [Paenibacillus daejeonensis]|uniref:Gfo/Idh/MocA family protein n=1 Tax=Paenibacillus daejeonensis TaxID=135193 RepID=UPI000382A9C2|nr:Gfo/Idh/MocA family oxidoreductase [Paenibacillus daejeonensis]
MTRRTILAGCGSMGSRWLDYARGRNDLELVGLVDVRPESAQALNERQGLSLPVYTSVAEAVPAVQAELLLDTSIPEAHAPNAMTAMASGCDVIMEKPLAVTMAQANELAAVAERTGRFCAVMQNRRYTKEIRSLKQDLDTGIIGKPVLLTADFFLGPHFGGFREEMDDPLLLDMAIHTFDAARYLIGTKPLSVYCHSFNPHGSWYKGDSTAVCIFEFEGGAVFQYNGSWSALGHTTSWEGSWRIGGTAGSALWNGDSTALYRTADGGEDRQGELHWQGPERRDACLNEMLEALASGRRSETDILDNRLSVAMMLGAMESVRQGRRIELEAFAREK